MELNFIEISSLKVKFAKLLSYLFHNANLELDNINDKLLSSSFLNMLEENRLKEFLSMPFEVMTSKLFPKVEQTLSDNNDIGEVYWSGLQYMNLFLNYRIPLRTLFLLCPLRDMVNRFRIYHEMNEIELCKDFLRNEYVHNSILKHFRNSIGLSVRELSLLSSVPEPTIKYLEDNNDNFYNATNKTLDSLCRILNIDPIFVKRKSSFLPVTYELLNNKEFVVLVSIVIGDYYLKGHKPNLSIKFYKDKNLDKGQAYLIVDNYPTLLINGKETIIDDDVFKSILDLTIDRYLNQYIDTTLVF